MPLELPAAGQRCWRELAQKGAECYSTPKIPFHLQLANEKGFLHEAIPDFVNNEVNQATATL